MGNRKRAPWLRTTILSPSTRMVKKSSRSNLEEVLRGQDVRLGRIVRRTMLKIEPEHGGIPVLPGEGDGAIGGVPESAKTEPEPNPRDLHEAGSISEFEGGLTNFKGSNPHSNNIILSFH